MAGKGKERVTKQIRVYEETWRLLDEIVKRTRVKREHKPTFADIVENWAREKHPTEYEAIKRSVTELDSGFPATIEGYEQND